MFLLYLATVAASLIYGKWHTMGCVPWLVGKQDHTSRDKTGQTSSGIYRDGNLPYPQGVFCSDGSWGDCNRELQMRCRGGWWRECEHVYSCVVVSVVVDNVLLLTLLLLLLIGCCCCC